MHKEKYITLYPNKANPTGYWLRFTRNKTKAYTSAIYQKLFTFHYYGSQELALQAAVFHRDKYLLESDHQSHDKRSEGNHKGMAHLNKGVRLRRRHRASGEYYAWVVSWCITLSNGERYRKIKQFGFDNADESDKERVHQKAIKFRADMVKQHYNIIK